MTWKSISKFAAEESTSDIPKGFRLCCEGDLCGYCSDPNVGENAPIGRHAFMETGGAPIIRYLNPEPKSTASSGIRVTDEDAFDAAEREMERRDISSPQGDGALDRRYIR